MCIYCQINNKLDVCGYYETYKEGSSDALIIKGKYEEVRIVYYDGAYRLRMVGDYENYSDPIKYCPFCGKKLNYYDF